MLGIVLSGSCEHGRPEGPRLAVAEGDVIGIAPRTPQWWRVTGDKPWSVISCIFTPRPHWVPWLAWRATAPGFVVVRPIADRLAPVRAAFQAAADWSASGHADAVDRAAHAIEGAILECAAHWREQREPDPRIERAVAALVRDLKRPMRLQDLVRLSGLSRAQLLRRFTRAVGCSPMAYRARLRLQRARELLLRSHLSIKEIAASVGFDDSCYFSRWFRAADGAAPGRWRDAAARNGPAP